MIGTAISVFLNGNGKLDSSMLLKESWHKHKDVFIDSSTRMSYSYYDSYIIKNWEIGDNTIIYEGCIFNLDDNTIIDKINSISSKVLTDDIRNSIAEFVNEADGDYVVSIYNKLNKRLIVFNDILGGMAVHYSFTNSEFHLSRSMSYVVVNSGKNELSANYLSEFLTFGYNISDHTIFEKVKKLTPGSCIIIEQTESSISFKLLNIVSSQFSLENPYKSKKDAIIDLCDLFLNSCKRRIEYAQKNGFQIVNTMSGGYDSRTILGGIEKYEKHYTNLTYEYKQDESIVAKKVLDAIDSESKYVKLSFENVPNIKDSGLTFETDGKIESYTNSVCYNDLKNGRDKIFLDKKILYFGGFGGEFIRHPMKSFIQSPKQLGLSFSPSVKITAGIFKAKYTDVMDSINKTTEPYANYTHDVISKYLYNEYYQNYVRCSGEERTRLFYYTVQPMMAKDFILSIRRRVPLKWAGFRFYTDFLNQIDNRLTKVELFGNKVNIKSHYSLFKKDIRMNCALFSYVRYLLRKYTSSELAVKKNRVGFDTIEEFYKKIQDKSFIDFSYLCSVYDSLGGTVQLRLLTLLEYVYECEKKIKNKSQL